MNPLRVPWGKKPPTKKEKSASPPFIGIKNEAARENRDASSFVSISVRGVKGAPNGSYLLPWSEGACLKYYLSQINLITAAIHSAILDDAYPEEGRLRLRYVPKNNSRIKLGAPSVGAALQYQRSSHDAQRIAYRMGGGTKVVEMPLSKR